MRFPSLSAQTELALRQPIFIVGDPIMFDVTSHLASLSGKEADKIDAICDQFQKALENQGRPPRIEDYLIIHTEPHRSALLQQLLRVELNHRFDEGDPVSYSDYADRFNNDHDLELVAQEVRQFVENPTLPEYIGKYKIIGFLGSGAFAKVYRAIDPNLQALLGCASEIALKVPHLHSQKQQQAIQRLRNELVIVRHRIRSHHHIVPIYDIEENAQYGCIVTMNYVPGRTLAQQANYLDPAPHRAACLIAKLAEVVSFIHSKGVVHRDLKPENVLIDSQDTPLLCDFGLAAITSQLAQQSTVLAGTPAYMAPEALTESDARDERLDVWSLGVILYELLTGRRPFPGETHEQVYNHIHDAEIAPPQQCNPSVPDRLSNICLDCIKICPHHRPVASDLHARLSDWLTPGRITPRQPAAKPPAQVSPPFEPAQLFLTDGNLGQANGQAKTRDATWNGLHWTMSNKRTNSNLVLSRHRYHLKMTDNRIAGTFVDAVEGNHYRYRLDGLLGMETFPLVAQRQRYLASHFFPGFWHDGINTGIIASHSYNWVPFATLIVVSQDQPDDAKLTQAFEQHRSWIYGRDIAADLLGVNPRDLQPDSENTSDSSTANSAPRCFSELSGTWHALHLTSVAGRFKWSRHEYHLLFTDDGSISGTFTDCALPGGFFRTNGHINPVRTVLWAKFRGMKAFWETELYYTLDPHSINVGVIASHNLSAEPFGTLIVLARETQPTLDDIQLAFRNHSHLLFVPDDDH